MSTLYYESELYHHGIKGMKWGVRKNNYHSTGIGAAMARRRNEKIDEGFKKWNENSQKRSNAIELGKKTTSSKMAYESNKKDKDLRKQYKSDNKAYKKALKSNTTYRKGQVRKEVSSDRARKYLSEAKKVKKQMASDPTNKELQKKYNSLMSKHDVERARARRSLSVAEKRSRKKASIKRTMTMTAKAAAGTAAVAAGAYAANRYLNGHNVTLNGRRVNISASNVADIVDKAKKVKNFMGFVNL